MPIDPAAVTTKLAELAPAGTCTEEGTISAAGRLLVNATPVELAAVWESVTVQFAEAAAVRTVLSHCRTMDCVEAVNAKPKLTAEVPTLAVSVAG